jgi:DNA-directed RNA polymerase specialized sigma24 family protein
VRLGPGVDPRKLAQAWSGITRRAQIVELRYFGGLSEQEVATALSLSRATVTREWQTARAWLYRRMSAKARSQAEAQNARL